MAFKISDIPLVDNSAETNFAPAPTQPEIAPVRVLGIPQSSAPPPAMLDTFGQSRWVEEDKDYDQALSDWRRSGQDALDAAVQDPDKAFAGMNLDFEADPETAKRTLINESWMELHHDEPPAPTELQRAVQMQVASLAVFNEMASTPEELYTLIKKDAGKRKDAKALGQDLQLAAYHDAMLPSDPSGGYAAFRQKLKTHAGYDPEREADYLEAWHETRQRAKEKVDAFREPLVNVWRTFKQNGDITAAAMDAYAKLTPEQRPEFMDALAIRAKALPVEERATFWANMGKQTGQAISDYGRNAVESAQALGMAEPTPMALGFADAFYGTENYPAAEAARQQGQKDFQMRRNFAADVRKVAREDYDPLKSAFGDGKPGFWENVAYQAPGVTGISLTMAVPVLGMGTMAFAMEGQAYEEMRGRMLAAGKTDEEATAIAEGLAPIIALPQIALEKVGFGIWSRKLPGFTKALDALGDQITNRVLRGTVKAGTIATAETGIELVQDSLVYGVQDLAAALTEDVPDVDWSKELAGTWAQAPEIFLTLLPLAILGAAGGLSQESRNAAFASASTTELQALGITADGIAAIRAAEGPASLATAVDIAMATHDPNTEEAKAAVEARKVELASQRQAKTDLGRLGYSPPTMTQTNEGIFVFDADGKELGVSPDLSGALRIARAHTVALDNLKADQIAALGSLMEAAKAAVALDPASTLEVNLGEFDPSHPTAPSAARYAAQIALKEQAEGGTGDIARSVLGYSNTDFALGMRQTVNRLFNGASVTEVFHETFHGIRRGARKLGTITRADEIALLRSLDTVLAGKTTKDGVQLRFIPEGITDEHINSGNVPVELIPKGFKGTPAQYIEAMLDEAFSEIGEMELLRTRKKDGKGKFGLTRGVISRNLTALAKLMPGTIGKWVAFMQAVRTRWGLSLSRAIAMKKAERDGTFDKEGYDAYLDKLLGLDQQTEHDAAVRKEFDRMMGGHDADMEADDIPFSIGRADRPFFSASNVRDLRHDKTAWLDAGADPERAKEIVSKYYKTAAFAGIPRDAVLLPMPSTSGRNILPDALANRISKDFGQAIEKRTVGIARAKGEAKNKRTFFKKEADPVAFEPVAKVIADLQGKRVFITEDVHNTGESWIAFARMLMDNGVEVLGVATLVSTEQRITKPRDIERLSEKVAAATGKGIDEVLPVMHSLFDGTFKQLFNKAEAEVSRSNTRRNAENSAKLIDIASSGRRAGAYSNPLRGGGESAGGILGDGGLDQGTFPFSIGRSTVTPTPQTQTFPGAEGSPSVIGPAAFSIGAYHGTPHKEDKFSTDKIGTGEGAQAFGWGLYFAVNREVAKSYTQLHPEFKKLRDAGFSADRPAWVAGQMNAKVSDEDILDGLSILDETLTEAQGLALLQQGRARLAIAEAAANLYTVTLDVNEEDLLDWDKPLSEQSEKVKAALGIDESENDALRAKLKELEGQINPETFEESQLQSDIAAIERKLSRWNVNVRDFYEAQAKANRQDKVGMRAISGDNSAKVSMGLLAKGIPGIRYLDGNSRDGGSGSYNYVIFDESKIKITEENGTPMEMGGEGSFSIGSFHKSLLDTIGEEELRLEQPKTSYEDKRQLLLEFSKSILEGDAREVAATTEGLAQERDLRGRIGNAAIIRQRLASGLETDLQVRFIGETIGSPEELAVKAQALRNPRFETFYLLATKRRTKRHKGGEGYQILDSMAITSRVPTSAAVFAGGKTIEEGLAEHLAFLQAAKADSYFLIHNHPSGDPSPSRADLRVTLLHSEEMKKHGIRMVDHVVINHSSFATIDEIGVVNDHRIPQYALREVGKEVDPYAWPSRLIDKVNDLGREALSPDQVALIARDIEGDRENPNHILGFITTARGAIASTFTGSAIDILQITKDQLASYTLSQGGAFLMLHAKASSKLEAERMINKFHGMNRDNMLTDMIVDYVDEKGRNWYESGMETGLYSATPAFYGLESGVVGERVQEDSGSFSIGGRYATFNLRTDGPTLYYKSATGVLFPDGHEIQTYTAPPELRSDENAGWWGRLLADDGPTDLPAKRATAARVAGTGIIDQISRHAESADQQAPFWEWLQDTLNGPDFKSIDPLDVMDALVEQLQLDLPVTEKSAVADQLHYVPIDDAGTVFVADNSTQEYSFGTLPTQAQIAEARAVNESDPTTYPAFSLGPAQVAGILSDHALARIDDPRRRTYVMSRIARDFNTMRLQIERMTALSGIRRSKGDLRREAMAREELAAEEKIALIHQRFGALMADEDLAKIKSQPVHAFLADPTTPLRGRLKSKAAAIREHPEMFQLHRAGDYDGSDGVSRSVFGGQRMPDQAAQELYDEGLIKEPTADALWEALLVEQKTVASMKELLVMAQEQIREAKLEAKQEANEWLATQGKDQEVNFSDKEEIRRSLRMLDAILLALPAEIRGKIGGYTQISMIGTDAARLAYLKDKLAKADKELETFLRVEYAKEWEELLKKAAPKTNEAGQRPTGSIAADAYDIFRVAEWAMGQSFVVGEAEADKYDAIADNPDTEIKDADLARVKAQMIRLTTNWPAADAARREQAVLEGDKIYFGGLQALAIENSRRRERLGKLRTSAIKGTGKTGARMEREAAKQTDATKVGSIKAMSWEFLSFGQLVNVLFGEKSDAAQWFSGRELAASNAAFDGFQAKANSLESLFDTLSGNRFDGEKLRHRMATSQTIQVTDALGVQQAFSEASAITFLLMWRQEDGKRHMQGIISEETGAIVSNWGWNDDSAASIESQLSREGKAVMAFLGQSYGEEYERINDVFRRIWSVSMPRHKMYAPLSINPKQGKADTIMDPVSGDTMGAGMTPGSLKNRSFSAIAQPEFKDAFQVFLTHARQMEHFIAYGEFSRDALGVINRWETRSAILAAGGQAAATTLSKWIDYFALGGVQCANIGSQWGRKINGMLGRISQAALVGRVSVLAMQSLQLAAASFKMPLGAFLTRFAKLSAGRLGWGDAINSDYIQRRASQMPPLVRDMLQGMGAGTPNRAKFLAAKLGETISGADALFTAGTYAIFYDYHLKITKDAAAAHREAERLTDQVAQPTRTGARSWLEVANQGNPAFRAIWNFSSDPRQKGSLLVYEAMRRDTSGLDKAGNVAFTAAKVWIIGGILATLLRAISRDLRNDDDDEIFDERYWSPGRLALMAATGPLSAVPYLGGMVEASTWAATGQFMPKGGMLNFVEDAAALPLKWSKGKVEPLKDLETLATGGAGFSGTSAAAASALHIIRDVVGFIENLEGPD